MNHNKTFKHTPTEEYNAWGQTMIFPGETYGEARKRLLMTYGESVVEFRKRNGRSFVRNLRIFTDGNQVKYVCRIHG